MVIRGRKKSKKQRGSRTCGWGAGKKHRGAGHRGGRGKAGVGKRGASRKTKYLARGVMPYGKRGMGKSTKRRSERAINLAAVYEMLDDWVKQGKAQKEKEGYTINLTELGYDKLLGGGKVKGKLNIIVSKVSQKAKQKLGIKS